MNGWRKTEGLADEADGMRPQSEIGGEERIHHERHWFVLERPRRDTNGGSETEVTVTSKLPSKYRKKR